MSLWIESHVRLGRHPKVRLLAKELGICRAQAIGHLHYLWWWAVEYIPGGDLSQVSEEDIAEESQWEGTPREFVDALLKSGWIDSDRILHDWTEHAGRTIQMREEKKRKDRDRQKRHRERTRHGDVTRDITYESHVSHAPTQHNKNTTQQVVNKQTTPECISKPGNIAPSVAPVVNFQSQKTLLLDRDTLREFFNDKFKAHWQRDDFAKFTARYGVERTRDFILRMEAAQGSYTNPIGFVKTALQKGWSLKED